MTYNVLLYEGNRLMLGRLSNVISSTDGFKLVARYQTRQDALGQGKVFNPNLILLDVDSGDINSIIQEFKEVFPKASIICTGEHWRADSASHLVQAGAMGYLLKPFTSEELKDAVETFAKGGMETSSTVMTFFSPKGKSGKTTLIANLAMELGRMTGEQVGIIDADLQFGDMAVFFNLNPQSTIVEASRDMKFLSPVSLNSYFVPVTNNVSVLCGTKNPALIDRVSIESLEALITMAKSLFRYILIDVPAGFNPTSIAMAEMSDSTYIVAMNNGGFEIKHMKRAIEIFRDWPDVIYRLKPIFTRVSPCNQESLYKLQEELEFPVEGIIPNEYILVSAAADNGRMALDFNHNSKLVQSIEGIADKIVNKKKIDWSRS